ncbi:hypothetical protein C4900_14670 [Acidiferrobacter thiooxydans]|uniref:Uncharacterized protein n=1 Tax=Acidiferrobacter thiooxydans TaxID=163359 RepID=A0A368HI36_9GAMM|nr:hypothetical protein C4900_14670 [Acidiferrobacter thiooxydans]
MNRHPRAFGQVVPFPKRITYHRPGPLRSWRCSRLDIGLPQVNGGRCLAESRNPAPQDVCAGSLEHAHEPCQSARSLPALAG